jgi:hypothetical protein
MTSVLWFLEIWILIFLVLIRIFYCFLIMYKSYVSLQSCFPKNNIFTYMIYRDQRSDSNQRPLLKSASTDVIISNHGPIKDILKSAYRKYSRSQRQYNIIKHTDGGERPYECHICHNRFKEVRHQIQTLSLLISMYSNIVHIYLEQDGT